MRLGATGWVLVGLIVLAHLGFYFLAPEDQARLIDVAAVNPIRYAPQSEYGFSSPFAAALPMVGHVFLHAGPIHLVFNLMMLTQVLGVVAQRLDRGREPAMRFLALFFGSAVGGGLAYLWINPGANIPAVGASGAVCGVFAAYLMSAAPDWRIALQAPLVRRAAFWFLLINVGLAAVARLTGVFPIAWEAHLGGFLAGGALFALLARPGSPNGELVEGADEIQGPPKFN